MDYLQSKQFDILMTLAYPLKGNAYIYNYILKTVDALVQIPPPVGKGQILDLICKIFSDPQYESEKNRIIEIITRVNKAKGTKIIKAIQLISMFRPKNTSLITPAYTTLSNSLNMVPPGYLDSMIESISKMQEKLNKIINSVNVKQIYEMIKNLMSSFNLKGLQNSNLFSSENFNKLKNMNLMNYLKMNKTGGLMHKKTRKMKKMRKHTRKRSSKKNKRKTQRRV